MDDDGKKREPTLLLVCSLLLGHRSLDLDDIYSVASGAAKPRHVWKRNERHLDKAKSLLSMHLVANPRRVSSTFHYKKIRSLRKTEPWVACWNTWYSIRLRCPVVIRGDASAALKAAKKRAVASPRLHLVSPAPCPGKRWILDLEPISRCRLFRAFSSLSD